MEATTIAAIATPVATSAVGIVRVSGPASGDIVSRVFAFPPRTGGFDLSDSSPTLLTTDEVRRLRSHHLYHGYIVDGTTLADEVLLALMRAPNSYTGEDVLEVYAHGGPLVLQTILSLMIRNGAEIAAPGAFTRRAFMNGKIDLTQAEAVADIIEARSRTALYASVDQVSGSLNTQTRRIRKELVSLLADLNADIEFGDQISDDPHGHDENTVLRSIDYVREQALTPIQALVDRHDSAWYMKSGVKVALAGKPNAGKSTLLNRILGRNRAIVTPAPGTTRDVLEEAVVIDGTPFVFFDTAGIGGVPRDDAEQAGMERARAVIGDADVVVCLVDVSDDTGMNGISDILRHDRLVVAINKIDLMPPGEAAAGSLSQPFPEVRISALTGQGVPDLKKHLTDMFPGDESTAGCGAIPNPRHRQALARSQQSLESMLQAARAGVPTDLLTIDLQAAIDALDEISGVNPGETVLDSIFDRFCVGK